MKCVISLCSRHQYSLQEVGEAGSKSILFSGAVHHRRVDLHGHRVLGRVRAVIHPCQVNEKEKKDVHFVSIKYWSLCY